MLCSLYYSYLACALMLRGKVNMSDIRRNIERCLCQYIFTNFIAHFFPFIRLQPSLNFVHWNQQGWKTGLCSVPPIGQVRKETFIGRVIIQISPFQPYSLLSLANNTCFRHTLSETRDRFNKLFKRKVMKSHSIRCYFLFSIPHSLCRHTYITTPKWMVWNWASLHRVLNH